ncbi:tryptophan 2,3-dioxygenase [Aquipuribacter nitratireducens]|uniref:Tryptophan 2,3-dioxygenase n=1 Tax=Aquipuribacter nitratireducens TaxID=650104 RepID=A0ABW0GNB8_9MICO
MSEDATSGPRPGKTYGTYLRVDELLDLQTLSSDPPEHDELLFITIHQVYELWFKQILWELDRAVVLLGQDERARASHTLGRVRTIVKVLVSQLDVLETMTPLEFASFRAHLESGSGFQSAQFREVEFALGLKDPAAVRRAEHEAARERLRRRLEAPSLWDALLAHLARTGHPVGSTAPGDVPGPATQDAVEDMLLRLYREDPGAALLCEAFTDLDEGVQEWRYRHVKMVERTIGAKPGTGGSAGAAYLRTTIRPAFPALWTVRSRF